MLEVILCKGLPGSGKSTWSKKQIDDNPGRYKRINKDDLRAMLDNSKYSKSNEEFILEVRDYLILKGLEEGKHIIVDDTNLHPKHFEHIAELIKGKANLVINDSFLSVSLDDCIKQDLTRFNSVGESIIRKMHYDFIYKPTPEPIVYQDRPICVICDLDGTVALLNGRNPYDASTCENDLPNEKVIDLLNTYINKGYYDIIFVSGREDKYRGETINWIKKYINIDITVLNLYMRKTNDFRKDTIIKKEIYDLYIKDEYNVFFVIDDRPSVIRMWKELGLFVFNVGDNIEF